MNRSVSASNKGSTTLWGDKASGEWSYMVLPIKMGAPPLAGGRPSATVVGTNSLRFLLLPRLASGHLDMLCVSP